MAEHKNRFGHHRERHRSERIGWLRAAVLGANDGIVSTASLIVGVASASTGRSAVLVAGLAGLVAGAHSMAAGEYVSVHSQADTEKADLDREKRELAADHEGEQMELAGIYVQRGLDPKLAREVAHQLMEHDALGAHARDELGITVETSAQPLQGPPFGRPLSVREYICRSGWRGRWGEATRGGAGAVQASGGFSASTAAGVRDDTTKACSGSDVDARCRGAAHRTGSAGPRGAAGSA